MKQGTLVNLLPSGNSRVKFLFMQNVERGQSITNLLDPSNWEQGSENVVWLLEADVGTALGRQR